jgi:hypothetical protein
MSSNSAVERAATQAYYIDQRNLVLDLAEAVTTTAIHQTRQRSSVPHMQHAERQEDDRDVMVELHAKKCSVRALFASVLFTLCSPVDAIPSQGRDVAGRLADAQVPW